MARNATILGTGSHVPETVWTNEAIAARAGSDAAWVHRTLGIRERHIASPGEATSDLALCAARRALESAHLDPGDLDLIIVATTTPDRIAPSTACILQAKLGAFRAAAFDLGAVCSGFLYGLSVGAQFVGSGTYDHVLVVGADIFSRITDWSRRDCVFFGDGAGAVVLGAAADGYGLLAMKLFADGRGRWGWTVPAGGSEHPACHASIEAGAHWFQMDGKAVFRTAVEVLPEAIRAALGAAGLGVGDITFVIPHQPGIGILEEMARRLGIGSGRVLMNMDRYANTSAGTIPILLDESNRKGLLGDGALVVVAAVGAGWTWGAGVMRWGARASSSISPFRG